MNLDTVKEFMNQFQTCVLSTVNGNSPQSATVGFSVDDNFDILIATRTITRKAKNLANNPNVSIVIGFEGAKTVQLQGTATEISAEELGARLDYHFEKVPMAKERVGDKYQVYFIIKPNWLRITDFTAENPVIETEEF